MQKTTDSKSSRKESEDIQPPISLLKLVARNIGSDRHTTDDTPFDSSIESILRKSHDGKGNTRIGYNGSQTALPHTLPHKYTIASVPSENSMKRLKSSNMIDLTKPVLNSHGRRHIDTTKAYNTNSKSFENSMDEK